MSVHNHVLELKRQLDHLYQTVEQLQDSVPTNGEVSIDELTQLMPQLSNETLGLEMNVGNNNFHHKDILFDETALLEGHPVDDKAMTPDIQIKRLTAQLTVAYKRIAQLEEQLLSRQSRHNGNEYIYS
ncbi:hypothetical protein Lepto7376_2597 [[Leptolyngbya] sp. PCC 7376]|uniref:hypothetical protein n=1 Tax=[Leptolyngbya] sp. PCC 7376 TaxID=111781 RepID=UPI00029F496F|nr:hypothetical protein [[Leptolyngbya] sp. PCC 7376]AFY38868.1 hypothetical protein Lepto7376_2597 [[Leptolyngbya] sp. PCC 7376]